MSQDKGIPFFNLSGKLSQGKLEADLHIKPADNNFSTVLPLILIL